VTAKSSNNENAVYLQYLINTAIAFYRHENVENTGSTLAVLYGFYTRLPIRLSVSPSTMFSGLFSAMCAAIALTLCTWLYIYDLQIKFEDGCYQPIFGKVMPLEVSHFKGFYIFLHFFSLCLQIFI
jgi:hypothetical protein